MPLPAPEPGLVINYDYLWHSEYELGREEGRKNRPCAVILTTVDKANDMIVVVLPITHTAPQNPDEAVEIPYATKQRLRLDDARSWVIVNEMNRFIWPGPDLRPVRSTEAGRFEYGLLPPALYRTIRARFLDCAKSQRLHVVSRTE